MENYPVKEPRDPLPAFPTFKTILSSKPTEFPKELISILATEIKSKPTQEIEPNFMKVTFSNFYPNTLFGAGQKLKKLIRYDFKRERLVCQSRLEVPRVDSIQEDKSGSIWVFSFGNERKIFEFSPQLTLLNSYFIDSPRAICKILINFYSKACDKWSDPTALSPDKSIIYYPAGMGRIGFLDTNNGNEPKFGYAQDKASKYTQKLKLKKLSKTYNF